MIGPYLACSIEEMLLDQARKLPAGTTLVLLTGIMSEPLVETLEMLVTSSGGRRRPVVLWMADWEPEGLPEGVTLINLNGYLADLEAKGEAPYMEALKARGMSRDEGAVSGKEGAAAEREHQEARDVPVA